VPRVTGIIEETLLFFHGIAEKQIKNAISIGLIHNYEQEKCPNPSLSIL
jgi:hypothetical protein